MSRSDLRNVYLVEYNRCKGDNINGVTRNLRKKGYDVKKIRHKTTIMVKRPDNKSFSDMKKDLKDLIQPKIGSMILASSSGKMWQVDETGNQPGVYQKLDGSDF